MAHEKAPPMYRIACGCIYLSVGGGLVTLIDYCAHDDRYAVDGPSLLLSKGDGRAFLTMDEARKMCTSKGPAEPVPEDDAVELWNDLVRLVESGYRYRQLRESMREMVR